MINKDFKPMKVGIITPMDPRTGISNYSETLAIELLKLGEEVTIISPENSSNTLLVKQEKMHFILPENYDSNEYDVTHFQLANSPLHEFQLHILNDHLKELEDNQNIITTVHDARNFDVFNLKCTKCISFSLKYLETPLTYPYDIVDKGFQRISNYLIFHNNAAMKEYENRYRLDNKSLRCIYHPAYRLAGTYPIDKVETNSDDNRFLAPGYISPFKGQDTLIKAVSEIDQDLKLILMGKIIDKNYRLYLEGLVKKLGVGDKVEFLGFVSADEFIKEYDRAQAVLVPRLTSSWLKKESVYKLRNILGLKYLINHSTSGVMTKALASGKPVICSKNKGFSDYVDTSNGILCEDKVESWRNAIKYILESPNKVGEMSLNSRKFANEKLNPAVIAKKHLELYLECIDK